MEKQLIFKEKYVLQLKADIETGVSLENYSSNVFVYDKKQVLMMPNIAKTSALLNKLKPDNDFETAVQIFEAFKNSEPIQASDERLWTYLSHVDIYPYTFFPSSAVIIKRDTVPIIHANFYNE